jgi:hypothetical protein
MQTNYPAPPLLVAKRIGFSQIQHSTNVAGLFAYERDNNFYYAQTATLGFSLPASAPQPFSGASSHMGAPLSLAHAGWQKNVSNKSIFRYLLPHDNYSPTSELSTFIKEWYQTSCAIVFLPDVGEPKIIGTGTLIAPTEVVTARHNFQSIPAGKLYVRFFYYEVQTVETDSHDVFIKEKHLDIPVTQRSPQLFKQYMKVLPVIQLENFMDGKYLMFHFAGGKHQISSGEVKSYNPYYSTLHTDIEIHAGPGASGATVLMLNPLSQAVSGCAISVFRMMQNDWPERRLITFHKIYAYLRNEPDELNPDRVCAPYYYNTSFKVIPTDAFIQPGYEFVYYRDEIYGHQGPRPVKPKKVHHYDLLDENTHSNHHIIPIRDLVFLWDYFHHIDNTTSQQITNKVTEQIKAERKERIYELNQDIHSQTLDYTQGKDMWDNGRQKIQDDLAILKETLLQEKKESVLKNNFGYIINLFTQLCPHGIDAQNRFAWAYWNLFQGWNSDHRNDDPRFEQDPSEKTKPLGFTTDVWNALKDEQTGLHRGIQDLIKANAYPAQRSKAESLVITSLNKLSGIWGKHQHKTVHSYNPAEWLQVGYKNDHPVYELRKK